MAGCAARQAPPATVSHVAAPTAAAPASSTIRFTDVTAQAGIRFRHNSGAFGLKLMPETMGSGVAFLDFDGDGYQDLFFVNCRYWTQGEVKQYQAGKWSQDEITVFKRTHAPGTPRKRFAPARWPHNLTPCALYRNNGDGTFKDVTRGSGLDVAMFGMGAIVGDYDNDGHDDLYVTGLGRNYLFHNLGKGRFREVAPQLGVQDAGWSTSAAWLDYDKDGRLDLFVCHYVKWTPSIDRFGTMNGFAKSYTAPYFYEGEMCRLFHQKADGQFEDASVRAGIRPRAEALAPKIKSPRDWVLGVATKALGVAVCDFNNDGWPDVAVANDSQPNCLYRNEKGKFSEVGTQLGFAYDNTGNTRAGMGIDVADMDHSNRDSIVIGNFDNEMMGLYWNRTSVFSDIAPSTPVGLASKTFSVFGCLFADVDNDGWADILTASGHIDDQINGIRGTAYALRPLLFHNQGRAKYAEIGAQCGAALQVPQVGRGLAAADFDLDGDLDFVLTTNGGTPLLLRNDAAPQGNAIRLRLKGTRSNRSAIGTLVKAKIGSMVLRMAVHSGGSYLSQSELPVTLGLGGAPRADGVALRWPSGKVTLLKDVDANQVLTVSEESDSVQRQPFPHRH